MPKDNNETVKAGITEKVRPWSVDSLYRTIPKEAIEDQECIGGGAGTKYYPPYKDAYPGIRLLYQKKGIPRDRDRSVGQELNMLLDVTHNDALGGSGNQSLIVAELLPQLYLQPEQIENMVPKTFGVGLHARGSDPFYYAMTPEMTKEQKSAVLKKVWGNWSQGNCKPEFFTAVEHMPLTRSGEDPQPEQYCRLEQLVNRNSKDYQRGLMAGLQLYLECLKAGIWNFDIVHGPMGDKEPFFYRASDQTAKVIDVGGFKVVKGSEAAADLERFYRGICAETADPIKNLYDDYVAKTQDFRAPNYEQNEKERQRLGEMLSKIQRAEFLLDRSMDPLIEKLTFKEIAKLLKSSYLEEFMQSQVETKALQELKHCYESLSSGKGYWEMESENLNNLEDLLETIIITVRRHGHQLNLMKFKDSDL